MISNHQNRVPSARATDSAATTKGQTTLSLTDFRYSLDHREINKRDKNSHDPIIAESTSSVSTFVNVVETETLPRHRAYACSSVNDVARAFGINVVEGELTAICSVKEIREAFELGPGQDESDVSQ
jgi:hypothetical protein